MAGIRLDRALSQLYPDYSLQPLKGWIRRGWCGSMAIGEAKSKVWGELKPSRAVTTRHSPETGVCRCADIPLQVCMRQETLLIDQQTTPDW